MNPYIEILRPGNALMGAISIILIAIIDKTARKADSIRTDFT